MGNVKWKMENAETKKEILSILHFPFYIENHTVMLRRPQPDGLRSGGMQFKWVVDYTECVD